MKALIPRARWIWILKFAPLDIHHIWQPLCIANRAYTRIAAPIGKLGRRLILIESGLYSDYLSSSCDCLSKCRFRCIVTLPVVGSLILRLIEVAPLDIIYAFCRNQYLSNDIDLRTIDFSPRMRDRSLSRHPFPPSNATTRPFIYPTSIF